MKMLMKLHSNSFTLIAPYIMSSITNVFVKNPKMFAIGNKVTRRKISHLFNIVN